MEETCSPSTDGLRTVFAKEVEEHACSHIAEVDDFAVDELSVNAFHIEPGFINLRSVPGSSSPARAVASLMV